mgnify:CR=1 FL=1
MPNSHQPSKVTIEDLLHLKKAERPSPDFWSNFERELRQKQLSALVEKRAWWHDLPQFFPRRVYLPISAAAVFTFTLVSVSRYNTARVEQPQAAKAVASIATFSNTSMVERKSGVDSESVPVSSPLVNRAEPKISTIAERSSTLVAVRASAEAQPELSTKSGALDEASPSARSIAANFARLEQSDPELISSVLGSRLSSRAKVQSSPTPVVELASLQMNGGRRTRLVASYNDHHFNAGTGASDAVREKLARRLEDNDFNDHFSRVGLNGDKVSLRF